MQITTTKTKSDYAHFMQWVAKEHYAAADKIKVVQDNYAPHSYGAFYENLPAEEARQLKKKTEFHFTPKHGSWLNMAEIEFSVLSRQCLNRRIGSQEVLEVEALAWERLRNEKAVKVNWSFTTEKAREKLENQYKEVNKISVEN